MILNSWKEIASHLGCSVRTAQRFEQDGMPVRRPAGHSRSAVVAFPEEIDTWMASQSSVRNGAHEAAADIQDRERVRRLRAEVVMLKQRMLECRTRSAHLRQRAAELRSSRL
jgi:phage terminase Nu1 subunit (DNA packaging protein)